MHACCLFFSEARIEQGMRFTVLFGTTFFFFFGNAVVDNLKILKL